MMMQKNRLLETLLENDLNPYILFDSNGKLKDFNKEAEFLFNFVKPKELYELAILYASIQFGFSSKYISLRYDKLRFYAILVGYIDDDTIALRLYKEVCGENKYIKMKDIESINIFSLIDLSKNSILLQNGIKVFEYYDISIPDIKLNINDFLFILNDCFSIFKDEKILNLEVYIKIGEYEIIDGKKYKIIVIKFKTSKKIKIKIDNLLQEKISNSPINLYTNNTTVLDLELPMVL
jgi:hypothetical protein